MIADDFVERLTTSYLQYTDSVVFEDTKLGRVFFYIHGLVHIRVHTTVMARNLEIQNLSLGTKWVRLRLIVTIPTMSVATT